MVNADGSRNGQLPLRHSSLNGCASARGAQAFPGPLAREARWPLRLSSVSSVATFQPAFESRTGASPACKTRSKGVVCAGLNAIPAVVLFELLSG
jgi:hypothetical protein